MKQFVLSLFAVLLFTSCLDKTQSHYTPTITTSFFIRNNTDTLSVKSSDDGYVLDSIVVGDTISFSAVYDALGNNLLSAHASWDTAYVHLYIKDLSNVRGIMTSSSDSAACYIALPVGYQAVSIPYAFVVKKSGKPKLTFTAESDSKFSPYEITLVTPIK